MHQDYQLTDFNCEACIKLCIRRLKATENVMDAADQGQGKLRITSAQPLSLSALSAALQDTGCGIKEA